MQGSRALFKSPSSHLSAPQALIIDGSVFSLYLTMKDVLMVFYFSGSLALFIAQINDFTLFAVAVVRQQIEFHIRVFPVGILSPGCALKVTSRLRLAEKYKKTS